MDKSIIQTLRSTRPMLWETFKTVIPKIQDKLNEPLFRGQGNQYLPIGSSSQVGWRLESSLYRIPGSSNPSFIGWLKNIFNDVVKKEIESIIGLSLDINNLNHREKIIALLRHMEFATPLLDWTKNPFKAAYFAFKNAHPEAKEVAMFLFDQHAWKSNPGCLTSRDRRKVELKIIKPSIPRQNAQECVYTYFKGGIDIYSQILGDGDESEGSESFITYWYLSVDEKDKILNDLKKIDITQESLFPDESDKRILSLKKLLEPLYKEYCLIKNQQYKHRCQLAYEGCSPK